MRKLFTFLTMCLLASTVWAVDIVFDPATDVGTYGGSAGAFSISKDGITIDIEQGMVGSSNGTAHYRFYKNKKVTITSSAGNMSKVVFTCVANGDAQYGPGCFTSDPATYNYQDNIGTWTGDASKVVFTATSNQVRATKIVVTVNETGVSMPTISPAAGTYYSPIEVSMTCSSSGAKIYYTTNGSDPTTSSKQYSAPFTLSSNTTVKAIAAKDGKVSDVVTAEYVFETATHVANIAAYQKVADGTVVLFDNPVYVTAQNGQRLFVKDNTGYAFFYGKPNQTYQNGDVIPAGFAGKKITYGGEPELTELNNFKAASGNTPIEPTVITANQISKNLFGQYVKVMNAEFDLDNMLITDASGEGAVYFNMNVKKTDVEAGVEYHVTGVIGSYGEENVVYQMLPTQAKRTDEPDPDNTGLGELHKIADNTNVRLVHNATVLWSVGSTTYAMDDTGYGLIYGNYGTFAIGDIIRAPYKGKKTTYNGMPELQNCTDIQQPTEYVKVTAEVKTIPDLGESLWAHYVRINQVKFTLDGDNGTITDANGNTFPIFTKTFGFVPPADGQYHNLWAIVGSYKPKNGDMVIQLLPISVDEEPGRPIPTDVANLQELYQLNKTSEWGHFTTPLTVVYHKDLNDNKVKDTYVIDVNGEFGLVYGTVNGNFKNGDIINDAIAAWTTYNDNKQLTPNAASFVVASHGTPVEPLYLPIEEITQSMVHSYFGFDNVSIISREEGEKVSFFLVDENGDEMLVYNRYQIDLKASEDCNVRAFMSVYNDKEAGKVMELFPIEITYHGEYIDGDVNGDGEVSIGDVNALINIILGGEADAATKKRADVNEDNEISLGDVNALINIILS